MGWANCYYQDDQHDYVDEWGVGWRVVRITTPYGVGHYTEPHGHPLANAAALSSYRPPDPSRDELYLDSGRAIREFSDDYWIAGVTVTTIFEAAWARRGLERLLMDFIEAPDLAAEILEIPYRSAALGRDANLRITGRCRKITRTLAARARQLMDCVDSHPHAAWPLALVEASRTGITRC